MTSRLSIGLFLEDLAHERFLCALVRRLASEQGVSVDLHVENDTGGRSLGAFREFMGRVKKMPAPPYDIAVVAVDANCKGPEERRRWVERKIEAQRYGGTVVIAVPDPHIEKWYLADPVAVGRVAGAAVPAAPAHKCEKGYYKSLLRQAFLKGGVRPLAGGAEYGGQIADTMSLDQAAQDSSLGRFISDLRSGLRSRS